MPQSLCYRLEWHCLLTPIVWYCFGRHSLTLVPVVGLVLKMSWRALGIQSLSPVRVAGSHKWSIGTHRSCSPPRRIAISKYLRYFIRRWQILVIYPVVWFDFGELLFAIEWLQSECLLLPYLSVVMSSPLEHLEVALFVGRLENSIQAIFGASIDLW